MSEADAINALREAAAFSSTERLYVGHVLGREITACARDDNPEAAIVCGQTRALLSAAPALLARIEAGEGLLREARERLNLADRGNTARRIEARIDAFLAAKEAPRRDPPDLSCGGWNFHVFSLGASACSLCGKNRTEIEAAIDAAKREGANRG